MSTAIAVVADVAIVTALALLVCRVLRRRSAALRHMILAASFAAAAAAPIFEIAVPPWEFPVLSSTSSATTFGVDPGSEPPDAATAPVRQIPDTTELTWTEAIVTVWVIGFVVVMGTLLTGLGRVAVRTRRCQPVRSSVWREQADAVSRQYGGARHVTVLESHDRVVLTWGLFRPRIIVPADAASWAAERIAIVLAHEFAHIARRDWALLIAAETLCAVYWFNPLIWMTRRRLRDESEQACDDSVLRRGINAADYAAHLVAVAQHLLTGGRGWTPAPAVVNSSTLEQRIASMLNTSRNREPVTRVMRAVTVVTMIGVTATVAAVTLTEPLAPALSARDARHDVRLIAPAPAPEPPGESISNRRRAAARLESSAVARAAQQAPTSLSGTVRDSTGAVMPGVDLTMTDRAAGTRQSVSTDLNGRFVFRNLPPSRYELAARLPGFTTVVHDVTLAGGQDLQHDVVMRIGALMETIRVVCAAGAAAAPHGAAGGTLLAFDRRAVASRLFTMPRATGVTPPALAAQPVPVRVGGQITAPRKIKDVRPGCPGTPPPAGGLIVILEAVIGVDGVVGDIRSLRPTPAGSQAEFVTAAMEAVRQWEFTPTRLNNLPVPLIMSITVVFGQP